MQETCDAWAEEQQRIAKVAWWWVNENLPKSLWCTKQFQEERGLYWQQADEIIFHLINIVRDGVMGKFQRCLTSWQKQLTMTKMLQMHKKKVRLQDAIKRSPKITQE